MNPACPNSRIYGHRARIGYTSPPLTTEILPYELLCGTHCGAWAWTIASRDTAACCGHAAEHARACKFLLLQGQCE